ncbi:MAG: NirD/YgiW/YdeI family stress tolerance protein [Endomicrobium sp.]|nr:NirD/YgiW/YdeI family stress tolerance protein [Endomicrobium sp.]
MKKGLIACFIAGLFLTALAASAVKAGYVGPGALRVSVAEAKKLKNNKPVILSGKIEKFLGDEKYLFSDNTGTIQLDIDDEIWKGLSVDQNDTVEISGEIDKEFTGIEIEVDAINKKN